MDAIKSKLIENVEFKSCANQTKKLSETSEKLLEIF